MRWLNLMFILALNAVPLNGVLFLGWSVSTVLVLYWLENLLGTLATGLRIYLHWQWTRKRGHWSVMQATDADSKPSTSGAAFLVSYLAIAIIFTLAHGIFVWALTFSMGKNHPGQAMWVFSGAQFRQGALWMIVFLMADLIADVSGLRRRSFAWIKRYTQQRLSRVIVLHIAIIFGMMAIVLTNSPLGMLGVLVVLKTLADLSAAWKIGNASDKTAPAQKIIDDEQIMPPAQVT